MALMLWLDGMMMMMIMSHDDLRAHAMINEETKGIVNHTHNLPAGRCTAGNAQHAAVTACKLRMPAVSADTLRCMPSLSHSTQHLPCAVLPAALHAASTAPSALMYCWHKLL
jgi:hypothetical protein